MTPTRPAAPPQSKGTITFEYQGHPGHVATASGRNSRGLYYVKCSCGISAEVSERDLKQMRRPARRGGARVA